MARRLSQEDLALVVKRAAELHLAGAGQPDAMLDEEAVLAVLQEAGVSKDAAGQALSEWRRGSLEHGITLPAPMPAHHDGSDRRGRAPTADPLRAGG